MTQFWPFEWNTFDDSRGGREKKATKKNWWASHLSRRTPCLCLTRLTLPAPKKIVWIESLIYSKGFNLRNWCFFNESSNKLEGCTRNGLDVWAAQSFCGLFPVNWETVFANFSPCTSRFLAITKFLQICSCFSLFLEKIEGSYVMTIFNVIKAIHNCTFYGFLLTHILVS